MKTNFKEHLTLKLGIVLTFIFSCLSTNIQAQEPITNDIVIETQADKDWAALNKALYAMPGYDEAIKKGFVEMKRCENSIYKKRSQLVKSFWDNYPEDKRHDQALYLFFNSGTEPFFISDVVPDSLAQRIRSFQGHKEFRKKLQLMPRDDKAWETWRQTGDDMITSVLNSNASMERKEAAEFQRISREFRYAIRLNMPLIKEKSGSGYWNRFEIQYWQHIRLRLENHVNKYAELDIVSDRVQNILTLTKLFSSAASEAYWRYFLKTTGSAHPQADQPGIKALYKLAKENVTAIEALKEVDYSKPLDMAFTAMDGSKVDLANLQGKVVLIDFWATYCGSCIKEMPHVRAMYDKYRDQGFEVTGIAADGDGAKNRVLDILKKTGANWPQRLDQGSEASVSLHALYKITALPTVWLLNKEGVIVDRDARGERLEPLIRKYLGLEK